MTMACARPAVSTASSRIRWPALILHIHREVIHHGAEICLLRDLYGWQH